LLSIDIRAALGFPLFSSLSGSATMVFFTDNEGGDDFSTSPLEFEAISVSGPAKGSANCFRCPDKSSLPFDLRFDSIAVVCSAFAAAAAFAVFFTLSFARFAAAFFSSASFKASIRFTNSRAASKVAINLLRVPKKSELVIAGFSPK